MRRCLLLRYVLGSLAVHLFLLSAQISPSFWQEKDERAEQKRKNKGWPHWSGLNQRTLAPNADVVTTAPWGFVATLAALNFVYGNSAELFSLANRIEVFFGTGEARQTSTTVLKCSINFVSHFFSLAGERRKKRRWCHWSGLNHRTLAPMAKVLTAAPHGALS